MIRTDRGKAPEWPHIKRTALTAEPVNVATTSEGTSRNEAKRQETRYSPNR